MPTGYLKRASSLAALGLAIAGCGGDALLVDITPTSTPALVTAKTIVRASPAELYEYRVWTRDGRSVLVPSEDRGYEPGSCVTLGESLHPTWPRIKPAPPAACAKYAS